MELEEHPKHRRDDTYKRKGEQMVNTHQIGVKAIIERGDTILLIKRSGNGAPERYRNLTDAWDIPGGRLNIGEGLEEGLEREVAEEIGLRIKEINRVFEVK